MKLQLLEQPFSVLQLPRGAAMGENVPFCFTARTDEEFSVVCPTAYAPAETLQREDGWRAMRIVGVLDFSLVGILAKIATLLAQGGVAIFALSTYNTDYVLFKADKLAESVRILRGAGYEIEGD